MRCPTIAELPPPPPGKSGWPWTEEGPQLPETLPDGQPWPRISIVTPSYNQGQFIEETIRSVLLQGYPDLEYIIIDGGSKDASVEIIRKYEPWLSYWVSEKDRGQADAINKGYCRFTGEIIAWLNSDDVYMSGAIGEGAQYFKEHRDVAVVYGASYFVDAASNVTGRYLTENFNLERLFFHCMISQPSSFIRSSALQPDCLVETNYFFIMDYALWFEIGLQNQLSYVPRIWSWYRHHATSKSVTQEVRRWQESIALYEQLFDSDRLPQFLVSQRDKYLGYAYWRAGLAYWLIEDAERARIHLDLALKLAPNWSLNREFHNIVVSLAMQNPDPERWIRTFFNLVKQPVAIRAIALRNCLARYWAKRVFTPGVSAREASLHAWRAITLDPYWLLDRNVIYRALTGVVGVSGAERIRLLFRRDFNLQA